MKILLNIKDWLLWQKKTFKTKKKTSFIEFAKKINLQTNSRYVWNSCKILRNKWIKAKPSHVFENLQLENKVLVLNKICPPWVPSDPNYMPECHPNEFLESEFNFAEFNLSLGSRNSNSSHGLDGIDYQILKKLPIKYKLLLVDIFNEMYRTSDFPDYWKQAYVHLISKPDEKSFRPIALTSALCKLFETIVKSKFQW